LLARRRMSIRLQPWIAFPSSFSSSARPRTYAAPLDALCPPRSAISRTPICVSRSVSARELGQNSAVGRSARPGASARSGSPLSPPPHRRPSSLEARWLLLGGGGDARRVATDRSTAHGELVSLEAALAHLVGCGKRFVPASLSLCACTRALGHSTDPLSHLSPAVPGPSSAAPPARLQPSTATRLLPPSPRRLVPRPRRTPRLDPRESRRPSSGGAGSSRLARGRAGRAGGRTQQRERARSGRGWELLGCCPRSSTPLKEGHGECSPLLPESAAGRPRCSGAVVSRPSRPGHARKGSPSRLGRFVEYRSTLLRSEDTSCEEEAVARRVGAGPKSGRPGLTESAARACQCALEPVDDPFVMHAQLCDRLVQCSPLKEGVPAAR